MQSKPKWHRVGHHTVRKCSTKASTYWTSILDDILKLHDVNGAFTIKYMNRNGLYNPCLRGWTVPSAVWDYLISGFMEDQHVPIEQKLVYAIL